MPGILIYSDNITLTKQLITAGLLLKEKMNQPVYVILTGEQDLTGIANTAADEVFVLKGSNPWPESYADAIANFASTEQISAGLFGGTPRGKDIAAKVAAKLGAGLVTEAQSVEFDDGCLLTTRLLYGGLAVATEEVKLPALATIAPKTFEEAGSSDKQTEVITIEAANELNQITIGETCPVVREGVELSAANRIVSVGRGVGKKEDLSMIGELAQAFDAEIGCTRGIAEDYHWLPVERYIGISGQKVKPDMYFGVGVSGQVQHLAGMRESKVIVAIDMNENAPIFEAADYGIVGDLYEVVPLLIEALKS
ncbi:MAG: electron transfer flavoprotein subunit alpha/FixB family protein [Peptococcaceae bacterium]|nr:electron transfer flavoprotein subunit alpha/FixB family protein [Peptococcaceae bacterium]